MLKSQRFSSLFRHYAKYHGLRKDDLEYYFVNPLENEDTPESVQLQRGDTIMVRKRRKPDPPEAAADDKNFFQDMRELLDDDEHMDALFLVHDEDQRHHPSPTHSSSPASMKTSPLVDAVAPQLAGAKRTVSDSIGMRAVSVKSEEDQFGASSSSVAAPHAPGAVDATSSAAASSNSNTIEIRAHKCILTARAEYFKALFRKASGDSSSGAKVAFRESTECIVRVDPIFTPKIVRLMLEFLYTNRIEDLNSPPSSLLATSSGSGVVNTDDLLSLLHLSDMWQIRDLKRLCECKLIQNHMNVNTVARMYCATEDFHAQRLAKACIDFIMENIREVTGNMAFQQEMKHYPHLCIPVLKAAADLIPEPAHKKARTGDHSGSGGGGAGGSGTAAGGSSGGGGAGCSSSPVPDSDA
mmetsp:Transcript_32702/g.48019  ORF Transcript_32702/g.48019 Transcript_32702/m.48019 type:complete len:411 (-) Transcript_32702:428-1660(-)